jgi:hypothetical protein
VTAAVATGCTGDGGSSDGPAASGRSGGQSPDVALAAAVLADEQAVLDRVLGTLRRHPGLGGALAGARTGHRAHVALLTRAAPEDQPSGTPSVSLSVLATPRRLTVPDRPGAALAALARAESRLSAVHTRSALAAESGPFARVLASMAAAAAQQAASLTTVAGERR